MKYPEEFKSKLTPLQLQVVEKWEQEAKERSDLLDLIGEADRNNDKETANLLWKKLNEILMAQDNCFHGCSIFSNCVNCDEIESLLIPYYTEIGIESDNQDE